MKILQKLIALLLALCLLSCTVFAETPEQPETEPAAEETSSALPEAGEAAEPFADPEDPTDPTEPTEPEEPEEPEERPDEAHNPYITGFTDGCFHPNDQITRAEAAQILCTQGNFPPCTENHFPDVPSNRWYAEAVNTLAEAGIFSGYSDGTFRPNSPMARAELCLVLQKIAGITGAETEVSFSDVSPSYWGYTAVCVAVEQGWASGYSDGTFHPGDSITRAEAVVMLNHFYDRSADDAAIATGTGLRFFPDVQPGKWYYPYVMEAATVHTAHYENPEAPETWLDPHALSAGIDNGFWCLNGKLYLAKNGDFIHAAGSGTYNGVSYTCAGSTGVCTVSTEVLTLHDGELVLIKNGKALYAPGSYPEGYWLRGGNLYAAKNGSLLHTKTTATVNGLSCSCAGSSGVCTVSAELLTLQEGDLVLLQNGKPLYVPGSYPEGYWVRSGKIYAAKSGSLLHTKTTATVKGLSCSCAGASGVCTVSAEILPDAEGNRWRLKSGAINTASGLFESGGDMYYSQSGGKLLRNGDFHTLHFGDDCKYTSGNAAIDSYIENIYDSVTNSSMTQERKLYACYCHVFNNWNHYIPNNNHVPRGQDCSEWMEEYMTRFIDMGGGNCYCYASWFCYLARRCGYWQAKGVSGGTAPNNTDHGWVEMELNGTLYMFDPRLDGKNYSSPGRLYMATYDNLPWGYWRP